MQEPDWLKAFLAQRKLALPNGEMLFSYRTSKDEYQSLRELIAKKLMHLNGRPWTFSSDSECALFVLYASEWWRRDYSGGAWRWPDILRSIREDSIDLDPIERTHAVERGLKQWGHRPSDDGKKYFGAIVAQGGLPLKLVASGDGAVARLLIRGTRLAQLFGWDSIRLESFFKEHEQELVQHLREDDIHRLLASIVSTVLTLRKECQLAGVNNPIDVLDRSFPKWRDRFPIAVDDQSAEPLLIGLVQEAAKQIKPLTSFPIYFQRVLKQTGETFELSASVAVPATIPLSSLANVCGIKDETVPQSFTLELRSTVRDTTTTICDGRQLLGGADSTVMLTGHPKRITGDESIVEYLMVMRYIGDDQHSPVGIPGAESMDDALPWVFALRDKEMILAAVGSCRVPDTSVLVLVPENAQVLPADQESFVTRHGVTVGLSSPRCVYQILGSAQVTLDDTEIFRIRTSQTVDAADQLVWHGDRLHYASSPLPIFLGVPRLYRYSSDGHLSAVPSSDIEWVQSHRKGQSIDNIRHHRGPVDAWLLTDGERQRRFRIALESPNARIYFKSGITERQGQIEFHDWSLESVAVAGSLLTQQEASPALLNLHLQAQLQPPASATVTVCWPNCSFPLHFDLPFPSSGGRFYGVAGEPLDNNLSLPFRRLTEIRARVFDRNPNAPRSYSLRVALKSVYGNLKGASVNTEFRIPVNQEGVGELRLLDIETNLQGFQSQCDDLDALIELSLCASGKLVRKILLQKYDAHIKQQLFSMKLMAEYVEAATQETLSSIELRALPILYLDAKPVDLTQDSTDNSLNGHWPLSALNAEQGPWLVYAKETSLIQVRPTLYPGFTITEEFRQDVQAAWQSKLCPLGQAMVIDKSVDRIPAIQAVILEMAADYGHASWPLLAQHSQILAHLPLSTLDAFRAIASSPTATVAAILKLPVDIPRQMQRMANELGVIWELVPRSTLTQALRVLTKSWATQFKLEPSDPPVRMLVEPIFRSLGQNSVLSEVIELVLYQAGYQRSPKFDQLIMEMGAGATVLVHNMWQGQDSLLQRILLRTHTESRIWPQFKLLSGLINAMKATLPPDAWSVLEEFRRDLLWVPELDRGQNEAMDFRTDVANVPFLTGIWSYFCTNNDWWYEEGRIAQLRQIRLFDPVWFEVAFRSGLLLSLAVEQQLTAQRATHRAKPIMVGHLRRVISQKK